MLHISSLDKLVPEPRLEYQNVKPIIDRSELKANISKLEWCLLRNAWGEYKMFTGFKDENSLAHLRQCMAMELANSSETLGLRSISN